MLRMKFKKDITKKKDFQKEAKEFIEKMGDKEVKITAVQVDGYELHFFSADDFEPIVEESKPAKTDDDESKDDKNKTKK